jgi:hypothetical protein
MEKSETFNFSTMRHNFRIRYWKYFWVIGYPLHISVVGAELWNIWRLLQFLSTESGLFGIIGLLLCDFLPYAVIFFGGKSSGRSDVFF